MPELEDEEDSDHENWPQLETKKIVQYVNICVLNEYVKFI